MPQLDHFSFFSQVFWVLFFFMLFYFINLRYVLPAIAATLKVRKRVLQKSSEKLATENVEPIKEIHFEFFSLARTFISSPLEEKSAFLSKGKLVRECFQQEFQKVSPVKAALRQLNLILRYKG